MIDWVLESFQLGPDEIYAIEIWEQDGFDKCLYCKQVTKPVAHIPSYDHYESARICVDCCRTVAAHLEVYDEAQASG